MKTVIFGSRRIAPHDGAPIDECRLIEQREVKWIFLTLDWLHGGKSITEVISGMAMGVDLAGFAWGTSRSIPIKEFRPDWNRHGKKAGLLRNTEMAEYADCGICFHDGYSGGTRHMLKEMKRLGKPVKIHRMYYQIIPYGDEEDEWYYYQ